MSEPSATHPRVYIVRHGETEWTKTGQYTGHTNIPLTARGRAQITSTAAILVGPGKLLHPSSVATVYVSPLGRAQETFKLLFSLDTSDVTALPSGAKVAVASEVAEWNYGDWGTRYAGPANGERSPEEIMARLDSLIGKIKEAQRPHILGGARADAVVVAHGSILRCFAKRWLDLPLDSTVDIMLPPGAIGILSYEDRDFSRPAIYIGLSPP